ncbi:MAG: TonB-dependent receptor, partial [Acidobacteriota bacterium]|nr:TonB-dependent receptor [Acidobacteriota bacterium]
SASQQKLIPFLGPLGGLLKQRLDPANYPRTLALLSRNNGVFPVTERSNTGSLRIDHSISDNDQIFFRLNATGGSSVNTNLQSLTGESQGEKNSLHDVTLLANNNLVLNARLVSETRLSFNFYDSYASSQDPNGPEIQIAGVASLGRGAFLPTKLREWHGQLQQNFFYSPGRHSIRFGAEVNPLRNSPSIAFRQGGQFVFGKFLPLGALLNQAAGSPYAAASVAQLLAANGQGQLAGALNEPISALQDFNLGIPAAYLQSFGNPSFVRWTQRYNFFVNDVFRATPRLTLNLGARYEMELNKNLPNTFNNIAPRVGFAWAATSDRKTVVRGGFGIYYQRNNLETLSGAVLFPGGQLSLLSIPITGVPGTRSPFTGAPVTSADVYQAFEAEGILGNRPITALDFAQFGIPPGSNPYPTRVSFDKNWRRPYSEQASFEIERALGRMSFSTAFNFNRALHLPRVRDANVAYGPPNPDGSPTFVPINPALFLNNVFEPRGSSFYTAMILQVARRFSPRLTLDAHYTLSRVTDDATQLGDLPNNSLDLRQDRGLASFQQKHRFVASAVIVPVSGVNRIFGGFLIAPIVVAASGLPFNVETGLQDGQRPFGVGRNTGSGPSYVSFDMRVSRTFRLTERLQLEAIAEGFNILNRTNFEKLNNIVGDVGRDQLPPKLEGVRGNPLDPFSFTSANPPRQIQIALKIRW